ncbi:MAG: hypothetical protein DMG35_11535 [Acidobacteria bacterium]|nr:MAG: hypothetical protein DMG35_11535 [Acidobacteriota bacterium]
MSLRFAGSKILGIVTNNLWPRTLRAGRTKLRSAFSLADQPRATKSHPGRPKKMSAPDLPKRSAMLSTQLV